MAHSQATMRWDLFHGTMLENSTLKFAKHVARCFSIALSLWKMQPSRKHGPRLGFASSHLKQENRDKDQMKM